MSRKKKRKAHPVHQASPMPRAATPPDRVMLALAVLGLLITGYLAWAGGSGSASAFCTSGGVGWLIRVSCDSMSEGLVAASIAHGGCNVGSALNEARDMVQ